MTHIARIEFENWSRYAGTVAIDLEPTVYAVEAVYANDPKRSNWGGKSTFVEAIPFALYGWHRFEEQSGRAAGFNDEWITRGQSYGHVRLHLSDGLVITRSRERGKSTKLEVQHGTGLVVKATGDAAERLIQASVGLGRDDFFSTCFFKQKSMSRFVTADPGDRMKLISEWLSLAALQKAAKRASSALALALDERTKVDQRLATLDEVERRYLPGEYGWVPVQTIEQLVVITAQTKGQLDAYEGKLANLRTQREAGLVWDARAKALSEQAGKEGAVEQARLEAEAARAKVIPAPDAGPALATHQATLAQLRTKSNLAAGAFDGRCPVGSCPCPITSQLNEARDANKASLDLATKDEREARSAFNDVQALVRDARASERVAEQLEARHRALKDEATRRAAVTMSGPRPEAVSDVDLQKAQSDVNAMRSEIARCEEAQRQVLSARDERVKLRARSDALRANEYAVQAACTVLGRTGAQRIVAESSLGAIENEANAELGEAGVGLAVRLLWQREGAELADACEACGTPIRGQALKACPRCGAARGKAVVNRCDVALSDRSGAAEDIAGMAIQLSAAAWLREKRSAAWGSAVLDEPFGSLDEANRDAVAAHLLSMLRGRHGFSQAFVIAHSKGVLDAMPGRIIVRVGPVGSTLEVVR